MNTLHKLSLSLLACAAYSWSATDTKANKLECLIEMTWNQDIINEGFEKLFALAGIHDEDIQQEIIQRFSDQVRHMCIQAHQEMYTEQELDDLITFYSSPTGQKSIAHMPKLSKLIEQNAHFMIQLIQEAMIQHAQRASNPVDSMDDQACDCSCDPCPSSCDCGCDCP